VAQEFAAIRPAYSDDRFRARIVARCAEIGISQKEVSKRAGVSHDFLHIQPSYGRRIDSIERVAAAVGWDLATALELSDSVTEELVEKTFVVYRAATRDWSDPVPVAEEARLWTVIYRVLAARKKTGRPTDEAVLEAIAEIIAENHRMRRGSPTPTTP
jgi:lambda repressor-like predicted transcriptional regulator